MGNLSQLIRTADGNLSARKPRADTEICRPGTRPVVSFASRTQRPSGVLAGIMRRHDMAARSRISDGPHT